MVNKFNLKNNNDDDFTLNNSESDFKSLITRLKEISKNIDSLEKKYLEKF